MLEKFVLEFVLDLKPTVPRGQINTNSLLYMLEKFVLEFVLGLSAAFTNTNSLHYMLEKVVLKFVLGLAAPHPNTNPLLSTLQKNFELGISAPQPNTTPVPYCVQNGASTVLQTPPPHLRARGSDAGSQASSKVPNGARAVVGGLQHSYTLGSRTPGGLQDPMAFRVIAREG